MGGRGGSSGLAPARPTSQPRVAVQPTQQQVLQQQSPQPQPQPQAAQQQPPQPQQTGPIQNQVPDSNNTPVVIDAVQKLQGMSDAQLAQAYTQSKSARLPNHLNDADDATQTFVFTAGLNGQPMVLDQAAFTQYMKDNNIPQSHVMSRSINSADLKTSAGNKTNLSAQKIVDMLKYGRLTYIGGKRGGQVYGAGAYFDMNGGGGTGYGNGATMTAVLNPKIARPITSSALRTKAAVFEKTHPLFANATGGYSSRNMSIYALAMGYNVIMSGNGGPGQYHNIIDRSAMVMLK